MFGATSSSKRAPLRSLAQTLTYLPQLTWSSASSPSLLKIPVDPSRATPPYPPLPLFSVPSWPFWHSPLLRREHVDARADDHSRDPTRRPRLFVVQPRLWPEPIPRGKLDEALSLANSLEEQRDGLFDIETLEKELPPNVVFLNPAARSPRADTYFGPETVHMVKSHLNDVESKAKLAALLYKRSRLICVHGSDDHYTFGAVDEAEVVSARGRGSGGRGFISGAGETVLQPQRRRLSSKSWLFCGKHNLLLFQQSNILSASYSSIPFHGSFNPPSHSQYSHMDPPRNSSKSNPNPRATRLTPINKIPTQGREFGLISLENNQSNSIVDHNSDEFTADVEKVYRILRKFHSRVPKLELALQESGVEVRSGLTERVLNRCGDAGDLAYKFFVWVSRQPGYRHSYDVYKAMVKILGKMRQFGAVWALIEEMRKENPHLITPEMFVVLMRRFASARMVKKAVEVLDEMPKYGCEPDEYVFGCLLDALCKNGSVKDAASLFEEMKMRFTPTIKHFTSLLYGWCREGKLMEAKFVLIQMREAGFEPDIVVYNNLLNGYAVAGKMADAFDLLQEMRRKGSEPNVASFTILIQALSSQEKMEEAMLVFTDMQRSGCEADIVTYTTLISGFCKWGKINRAYELLDSMIQKGHTPSQLTYLHILQAHEKKEELEECLELVKEMQKCDCVPDLSIYNTVIRLACKLGEIKEGVQLWDEMEANRLSPGLDSFVIMINGFLEQGLLIEACEYFKEMVGRGLVSAPQYGILKDLLNKLLRADKLEMAKDIWSCMLMKGCELNVSAWTIWIHALFANRHVKEACSYCLDMMDADLMPQPDTFAKLMRGLKKLYNRQLAVEITEKVRKMAEERQVTFKMYKRRGERDLKEKVKAKKDGRKRRARRRRWGSTHSRANLE